MTIKITSQSAAKKEIQRLISSYEDLKKTGKYATFNEDDTCRVFLLPLFKALGWDTESKERPDEVKSQKEAGGQRRVDYSFNISGSSVLFLEAKQLSADLYDSRYVDQAINYGINKAVKFVILSDFEGLMVFNCLVKRKRPQEKKVIDLKYTDYLDRFDVLWLLSRESIASDQLNKYAEKLGHIENRAPINEILLQKFLKWRDKLIRQISSDNSYLTKEDVAECVQKLLNRLIFIRTCEDRQIEEAYHLRNLLKQWQLDSSKRLHVMLRDLYRDFDEGYNSNLFVGHELDKIKISDDLLEEIICGLYEDHKEDIDKFDFAAIDADILGSIYEQYLGTIQKEHGKNTKRKSHGIYYTPKYIVDYIVKNTLGKVIDDLIKNKEYSKIGKLKVLDPACGSGSFLLKALQVFDEAYAKTPEDKDYPKMRKIKALKQNIYGVDLDDEAAELTKLNLLLSAVSARKKLPNLDHNIECGNSLIDDPKVAGDKAFDWKKRFPDVMDKGGFDVIVGNPPYGAALASNEKNIFREKYISGKLEIDSFALFIEKGLSLLKEEGYFGFIIPNTILTLDKFAELRLFLLNHVHLYEIVNLGPGVFEDSTISTILLFFSKNKPTTADEIFIKHGLSDHNHYEIRQKSLTRNSRAKIIMGADNQGISLIGKLKSAKTISFKEIMQAKKGITTGNNEKFIVLSTGDEPKEYSEYRKSNKDKIRETIRGDEVSRYKLSPKGWHLVYDPESIAKEPNGRPRTTYYKLFESTKILSRDIVGEGNQKLLLTLDKSGVYPLDTAYIIVKLKPSSLTYEYLLGILNSKLINRIFSWQNTGIHVKASYFEELPIRAIDFKNPKEKKMHDYIVKHVNRILEQNEQYEKIKGKQTSKTERLKRQIEDTDREIDQLVYKLYGLTKEELAVVEGEK